MTWAAGSSGPEGHLDRPDRAVIDIGSNTVRLVVYSGAPRVPLVWHSEKVTALLGHDLSATGRMSDAAVAMGLKGLARFATILADLGIDDVVCVATAAAREAENGAEFLEAVRRLGLSPRLLSGEEEARGSAFGIIGAFPGAQGTVADLGGGSLELVMIEHEDCHDGVSLPLGTLRLPALHALGSRKCRQFIEAEMARAGWAAAHPGPLYMVGGTWRALAAFAMHETRYPLPDPHGFSLASDEALRLAAKALETDPADLARMPGISSARAIALHDAAGLLRVMVDKLQPDGLVFSGWGLREGLLFQRLDRAARMEDPLLAGMAQFASARGSSHSVAQQLKRWSSCVCARTDDESERWRSAATTLALALLCVEPALRSRQAMQWALGKRWLNLDGEGRACIAAALLASCGRLARRPQLRRLATAERLHEATAWGLAIRLGWRLGAGSSASLQASALRREGRKLVLHLDGSRAQLATDAVESDLKTLAHWISRAPELRVGRG